MSVRKRTWRDKQGRHCEKWMVHIEHTRPDGTQQTIRRVSPVQTKRGAERYERELRQQLLEQPRKEDSKHNQATTREAPTLAEFAEEFLGYQATLNKPTELRAKRSIIECHLIPAFGELRLDQIDAHALDQQGQQARATEAGTASEVHPALAKVDPGLNAKSVNNHLGVLGRMLRVAATSLE
jgi:hypothetical protein